MSYNANMSLEVCRKMAKLVDTRHKPLKVARFRRMTKYLRRSLYGTRIAA